MNKLKDLRLKALNSNAIEVLSKKQMKQIMGGQNSALYCAELNDICRIEPDPAQPWLTCCQGLICVFHVSPTGNDLKCIPA